MTIIWGIILTTLSSIAYFGQMITFFWPTTAARLRLAESETEVDSTFYADVRGEAFWDTATLWILPVAGVLLILNSSLWPYFGLVGGGMYLYFAGRGIVVRRVMQQRNIRIGLAENLKTAYIFLALWGLAAVVTIILAMVALSPS